MKTKTTTETREAPWAHIRQLLGGMVSMILKENFTFDEESKLIDTRADTILQLIQSEKQDLLKIVEREVIGEYEPEEIVQMFPDGVTITRENPINRKIAEQRKKLAEIEKGEK